MQCKAFLFSLFFMVFCFAKQAKGQSWAVGLHFGENLSTLRGNAKTDYLPGFMGGLHASHYLTENVVLRLEANFERKGSRIEGVNPNPDPGTPDFANDYRFDYLSLPVMLRYSVGKNAKFVVGGGASVDYLIRQRTDYGTLTTNELGDYRRFDSDLIGTMGGAIPFGEKWTVSLEMRALWGLIGVNKPKGVAPELGKNLSWGLMAGVNYYL
ncbi:MAG: PorT family protein [Saprospiraceae bacterium]|nr:PorT family protein [Saprospiraceae bacterium]